MKEETKIKVSISKTGCSTWNKGIKNLLQSGSKNGNWKGGITPFNRAIRESFETRNWRKSVFERDDYTCVLCKKRGVVLNADHIKPFSLYPELRFEINNGRTLCVECHRKTPTWGNRMKNYVPVN